MSTLKLEPEKTTQVKRIRHRIEESRVSSEFLEASVHMSNLL